MNDVSQRVKPVDSQRRPADDTFGGPRDQDDKRGGRGKTEPGAKIGSCDAKIGTIATQAS